MDKDRNSELSINDYQRIAATYGRYPKIGRGDITYPVLLLCSEAGEVAGKLTKLWRDKGYPDKMSLTDYSDDEKLEIVKELGDAQWSLVMVAYEAGFDAEEILRINLEKLEDRRRRNALSGSGDNR